MAMMTTGLWDVEARSELPNRARQEACKSIRYRSPSFDWETTSSRRCGKFRILMKKSLRGVYLSFSFPAWTKSWKGNWAPLSHSIRQTKYDVKHRCTDKPHPLNGTDLTISKKFSTRTCATDSFLVTKLGIFNCEPPRTWA